MRLPIDSFGSIALSVELGSRDLILELKTSLGTIAHALTAERALQLGVALIRASGQRYVVEVEDAKSDGAGVPDAVGCVPDEFSLAGTTDGAGQDGAGQDGGSAGASPAGSTGRIPLGGPYGPR